ncbi:MAG: hypothetical protein JXB49_34365 [Bacteroidales bacterium]|nr:hypothetical protein [Bacteroidales bacterium]
MNIWILVLRLSKLLCCVFVMIVMNGCSLTKTQISHCNSYFAAMDDFYEYVNVVNEHSAHARLNRQIMVASAIDSAEEAVDILDSAIIFYQDELSMPFELRKSLMEIDGYVTGYNFRSSYNTEFLVNFKSFLVEYIPLGLGNIIYNVIYATRRIIIKPNVGRKIKNHVETGNEIIPNATVVIIGYSNEYIQALNRESALVKSSFIHFTEGIRRKPDSWENYSIYQPIFIRDFGEVYISQQMAEHLIAACENLKSAQEILYQKTRKHKKIKGTIPELTDFYVEINYLKDLENLLEKDVMPNP